MTRYAVCFTTTSVIIRYIDSTVFTGLSESLGILICQYIIMIQLSHYVVCVPYFLNFGLIFGEIARCAYFDHTGATVFIILHLKN